MSHDQGHHSRDWQNNPPSSQSQFSQGGPLLHESTEPIRLPKISRAPPRRTDHTYRDFSNYPVDHLPKILQSPTNFPSKLHHILSDPECHHVSQIRKAHIKHMVGASQLLLLINPCFYVLVHTRMLTDHLLDGEFHLL